MEPCTCMVDLGFTHVEMPAGSHICQIYTDENEREDSLKKFLLKGLQNHECTACFSEKSSAETLSDYFANFGISLSDCKESGGFTLKGTSEVYFEDGLFDPDKMLSSLSAFYENAVSNGYPGARVIGEMIPQIESIDGETVSWNMKAA